MRRGAIAAVLCIGTMLVAAACGDHEVTKAEYGKQLRAAMGDLQSDYGSALAALRTPAGGGGSEPTQAEIDATIDKLRTVQNALQDAHTKLADITPPESLQSDHEDLVAGVADMAADIDLLIQAQQIAATNPKQAQALTRKFASSDAIKQVAAAAAAINKAGVDSGL